MPSSSNMAGEFSEKNAWDMLSVAWAIMVPPLARVRGCTRWHNRVQPRCLFSTYSLSDHKLMITLNQTSSAIFVCLLTIVCLIVNQFKALFVWLHRSARPSLHFGFDRPPGAKNCSRARSEYP